jgi:KipI family sensor histidine kinase inhibitor
VTRQLLPVGDRALLVECPGEDPAGLASAVRAARLPGVVDVVPAAATVLVTVDRPDRLPGLTPRILAARANSIPGTDEPVVLSVHYDGPDLEVVSAATGMTPDEVIRLHQQGSYRVAFCGFAPGFAYLQGLDPALHLPRRSEPRIRVPAGSVAIAGPYTAVYPRATPGGWRLLGTCDDLLWDPAAVPPTRLLPGTPVRFEPR